MIGMPNIGCMNLNPNTIIDALGGTNIVARLCNVKPPSVSEWRKSAIPEDKLIILGFRIEQTGIATRQELRPSDWQDIWPELTNKAA